MYAIEVRERERADDNCCTSTKGSKLAVDIDKMLNGLFVNCMALRMFKVCAIISSRYTVCDERVANV